MYYWFVYGTCTATIENGRAICSRIASVALSVDNGSDSETVTFDRLACEPGSLNGETDFAVYVQFRKLKGRATVSDT
jgi:hypothetical protein